MSDETQSTSMKREAPKWPGPSSRLWTTLQVLRKPYSAYQAWRDRYGDTMRIKSLNGDVFVSCDPDFVRDVIKLTSEEHVPFGRDTSVPIFGPGSLLSLTGARHKRERKLLMPTFHGERMSVYIDCIQEIAQQRVREWRGEITLTQEILPISLDLIVQVVFGTRDPESVSRYHALIRDFIKAFNPALLFSSALQFSCFGLSPWDRFTRAKRALSEQLTKEIQARRNQELGDDILSMLLQASYEDGSQMSEPEMVDELITLLIAGHETTQISIAWALYWLHKHPHTLDKLRAELEECDGDPKAALKLPYLDAVINETLRLDPIVPDVLRTLTVDKELNGHIYPAGTHIAVVSALLHTREDLYPDPRVFKPERWLEQKPRPWHFFPFGGGVRRCIGAALAVTEMKLVIAETVQHLDLELLGDEVSKRINVVMGPAKGVRVRASSRAQATLQEPPSASSV